MDNNTTTTKKTSNKKKRGRPRKQIKSPITTVTKPQKNNSWLDNLTIREKNAVVSYCDGMSESLGNVVKSFIAAGYKIDEKTPAQIKDAARKLFRKDKIRNACRLYQKELFSRLEVTRNHTLQRLVDTYNRAVEKKDGPTQSKTVELMMKYNNMLAVNINVNHEYSEQLDDRLAREAASIGSARVKQIISQEIATKADTMDAYDLNQRASQDIIDVTIEEPQQQQPGEGIGNIDVLSLINSEGNQQETA